MAKTPRKSQPFRQKAHMPGASASSKYSRPQQYGGKNFNNIKTQMPKNRRFSLAESTSSDSSEGRTRYGKTADQYDHSDSESSLTALSEQDEKPTRTTAGKTVPRYSGSSSAKKSWPRPSSASKSRSAKSSKTVRKRVSTKSHYNASEIADDAISSDDPDEEDEENEQNFALGLHSMIGTHKDDNSSDSASSDDSQDIGNEYSSSDDSEVDFLVLQAEQRMNNLKAIKGLPGKPSQNKNQAQKRRRRSTAVRKRSEVVLPEDINFKFEFDQSHHENVFDDSDDEPQSTQSTTIPKVEEDEEEDIGEEVPTNNTRPGDFDFQFDEPLIDVPKIKDEDLNSDEEYEFDDNDLLATLQAENDVDEFLVTEPSEKIRTRQSSMSSFNDETEDPFLREEEKFLVNEFEINGFDDEELDSNNNETARMMDSFHMTGSQSDKVIQYASSSEDDASGSEFGDLKFGYEDDENDLDDYIDFANIDAPTYSKDTKRNETSRDGIISNKSKQKDQGTKKKGKRRGPLDSEEEDDSYLWNYFFSSDAESEDNNDLDRYDVEEQHLLEEVFRKDFEEKQRQLAQEEAPMSVEDSKVEVGYDSGESTDVDLSLPSSGPSSKLGSKVAKEVLSSRTADYRPPMLGTWVAIDSKPFSIIDGLSTRTLSNQTNTRNPRTKNWKSFSLKHDSDDLAIDLEELLNVSELDNDDENDVRIWRDFNNNKKHVPLGAFRNKSKMHHTHVSEPLSGYPVSKMNSGVNGRRSLQVRAKLAAQRELESQSAASIVKELNMPSKLKRRRASIADAVSEGYRPTKSGLFSENMLADVEEIMGDDRDFMALIKGL